MIHFLRNMFKSKLGVALTLGFVVLMGLAFAAGDISNSGAFGGVAGGDRVAMVGDERVDTNDLQRAATNAVEQLRAEDPQMTMKSFLDQNGLDRVLRNLIDLAALRSFGDKYGIHLGDRLVDSEIAKIPGVQGPDGKVSDQIYRGWLAQRQLTDAQLRKELGGSLMARQLLTSTQLGVVVPQESTRRFAAVVAEKRIGAIALLPSAAFAAKSPPSDAEVQAWYSSHSADYIRPERRTIRYATFGEGVLKGNLAPTDAELAARYNANKAQYAASESRRVVQLVLPTEAAAKAALAETQGKSLEAVAAAKGLSVAQLGSVSRDGLSGQSNAAVAAAAFEAAKGKVVGPVRSPLGFVLLRVDAIDGKPARTLDQVRGELVEQLTLEKRRAALTDFSARIEEEFDNGATLADVAKELGLTVTETPALTADGQVYGQPGTTAPEALAKVLSTAFAMESEGQPQLAEVEAGKTFMVFDVGALAASAPAPLAEIRQQVLADVMLSKGAVAAKAAAQKVEAAVKKGTDIGAAMASLGVALPPVDRIEMARMQVQQMGPDKTPPPLAMLFSLAKGGVKLMGAPRNRGWYVIQVKDVIPGTIAANDPRLEGFRKSLAQVTADEYSQQLRAAIRADVGSERNETAIAAVKRGLLGGN